MSILELIRSAEVRQGLRLGRFFMALAVYVVAFAIGAIAVLLGLIDGRVLLAALPVALVVNIAFYVAFRSHFNLRFTDPSLTLAQSIVASAFVAYGLYIGGPIRPVFLLLFSVPFLFGAFRLTVLQHSMLAAAIVFTYGAIIANDYRLGLTGLELRREVMLCVVLAIQLGWLVAIGNRLNRLHRRASRDELTGLLNRREIELALERELVRSRRSGKAISVCIIDVDHFKNINDAHGHAVGDRALRFLAAETDTRLRGGDYLGRYGGDELLAILPDTNEGAAVQIAERIRVHIQQASAAHPPPFTVSVGVAGYTFGDPASQLIAQADVALFAGKRHGRNRVESATRADAPLEHAA
jgi:diguanylate cyclase